MLLLLVHESRTLSIQWQKTGMNFLKPPATNGTAFTGISGKEDNLVRYTDIFLLILTGNYLSIWLSSGNFPEILVEQYASRNLDNFRIFWTGFQEISLPPVPFSKFSEFLVEWKAPLVCWVFYTCYWDKVILLSIRPSSDVLLLPCRTKFRI